PRGCARKEVVFCLTHGEDRTPGVAGPPPGSAPASESAATRAPHRVAGSASLEASRRRSPWSVASTERTAPNRWQRIEPSRTKPRSFARDRRAPGGQANTASDAQELRVEAGCHCQRVQVAFASHISFLRSERMEMAERSRLPYPERHVDSRLPDLRRSVDRGPAVGVRQLRPSR